MRRMVTRVGITGMKRPICPAIPKREAHTAGLLARLTAPGKLLDIGCSSAVTDKDLTKMIVALRLFGKVRPRHPDRTRDCIKPEDAKRLAFIRRRVPCGCRVWCWPWQIQPEKNLLSALIWGDQPVFAFFPWRKRLRERLRRLQVQRGANSEEIRS